MGTALGEVGTSSEQGTSTDAGTGSDGQQGAATGAADAGQSAAAGGGSAADPSWRDALPEAMRASPTLSKFESVEALAKSYEHMQGQMGKKGVIVPTDKSSDEEWGQFYDQLGRPALDKYELNTPTGVKAEESLLASFKEAAHKAGVLPRQAQQILEAYTAAEGKFVTAQQEAQQQQIQDGLAALKKEWDKAYMPKMQMAHRTLLDLGGQEALDYFEKTGLGNDANVLRLLARAGELIGDDKLVGDGGEGKARKTPAEIQKAINDIFQDKNHPYHHPEHAGYRRAQQEMEELHKELAPPKQG